MAIYSYIWLYKVIYGYTQLYMAIHGGCYRGQQITGKLTISKSTVRFFYIRLQLFLLLLLVNKVVFCCFFVSCHHINHKKRNFMGRRIMPGQHKNKSQLKSKLFNNRKESITVRAELMARQERERQFQLPSIQVT